MVAAHSRSNLNVATAFAFPAWFPRHTTTPCKHRNGIVANLAAFSSHQGQGRVTTLATEKGGLGAALPYSSTDVVVTREALRELQLHWACLAAEGVRSRARSQLQESLKV